MAILSGGPNSGFSGKAGSVVGYYRMGKWVIRGLPRFSAKNNGNTAHNSATSWNMLHAFDENGVLDYSKTRISLGSLEGAEDVAISVINREVTFTWSDNSVRT